MSKLIGALGLGAVIACLSAGSAFAAVATGSVNVRTGPGTWYPRVDTLYAGEQLSISDRNGGWCFVQKAGPDGWVSCRYLASGGIQYRSQPSVRLSLGVGVTPFPPMHRHRHQWDHNHDWNDDGGHWNNGGDWTGPGHDDGGHWSGPGADGASVTIY
jgi:uncharacterized protein YraI